MILKIERGVIVTFNGQRYKIKHPLSLERVLIEPIDSGEAISALVSDLQPDPSLGNQSDEAKGIKKTLLNIQKRIGLKQKNEKSLSSRLFLGFAKEMMRKR